jgi:CheY-like chemotaxis protein
VLRDADLRKDRWLALLAHELRGPLAPVRMVLGLPLDDDVPDELRRRLKMIDRQVSFMGRMVDDLLDMSRLDSGKLQLRCRPFDLGRLLSNFAEHSRLLVQAQGAHFVLQLPPGPVMIDADPMRIGQVVANLHSNARKFTPPGGVITVGLSVSADAVLLSVRDTGVGIEAENLERVFERFEQLTDPRNQPSAGLGLGLHLAREIVNAHGGRIEARSAGPGQGSEFIVSLPRRESCDGHATASWPEPQASQAGAARPTGSLRVLVVDDHRDTAESLVMLLQAWGHEAWCVHDGATGLREAEAKRPDVVILDISMPGMDGVEMARRIRAQPWGEPMVLIVQTGFGQESDFERTRAAGVQAHLVKPVEPERLRRLLAALASGGQVA